jgi:branched-chain amino acid transport system substrate-binding protein
MIRALSAVALVALLPFAARAENPIRIGFITTFSGPNGVLGQDLADGFKLALKKSNDQLGGRPVEVLYADDKSAPDQGRQLADKMIESNGVQIITGINYSNVLLAVAKPALDAGVFLLSPVAGPSQLAGRQCHPHFFSVSWQNDTLTESIAIQMQKEGLSEAYFMAPNYPGGRDQLAGFKRYFKGAIAEAFTAFNQLDYSAEIAALRAKDPKSVVAFYPGGMGVNFYKQFAGSGLREKVPLYASGATLDQTTLPAIGDAAIGIKTPSMWSDELDNAESREFVVAFQKEYRRMPSPNAAIAYDVGRLIDGALALIGGKIEDKAAFQNALERAPFKSVRGGFKFNTNHFPIQNFYLMKIAKNDQGEVVPALQGLIAADVKDVYADQCVMTPARTNGDSR